MKKFFIITLATAILFSAGCTSTKTNNMFYPMNQGSVWNYETNLKTPKGEKTFTSEVKAGQQVNENGKSCTEMIYNSKSSVEVNKKEYYTLDNEKVQLVSSNFMGKKSIYDPPITILPAEKDSENNWDWSGKINGVQAFAKFTQTKGNMDTVIDGKNIASTKVTSVMVMADDNTVITEDRYFAFEKGLIRSDATILEKNNPQHKIEINTIMKDCKITGVDK